MHHPQTRTGPKAGSLAELLRVALPLMISSGSASLMYVADRVFLTSYSLDAVAAVSPAGMLNWTLLALGIGVCAYCNAFVSQYEGANKKDRVAAVIWQGVYFALAAGVIVLLCAPLAPYVFKAFRHERHIQELEAEYFSILCFGGPPLLIGQVLSAFFSGRGKTLVVMFVSVVSSAICCVLEYLLIFRFDLGIRGAGAAHAIAYLSMAIMYIAWLWVDPARKAYHFKANLQFDRELFSRLLRYGFPSSIQTFFDIICFTIFLILIGQLGALPQKAASLAFNMNSLVFVPLMGLGTAVMSLTGRRFGEQRQDLASRTAWLAMGVSAVYVGAWMVMFLALPDLPLSIYSNSHEAEQFAAVRDEVARLLRYIAIYSLFDAMLVVFSSATRGAGDTRFAMLFSLAVGALLMVLPTALAVNLMENDPVSGQPGFEVAWISITASVVVLGVGFLIRFLQGHWKELRIVRFDQE